MSEPAGAELVSVVIPVFRGDPYLGEAIATALAQTWPAIEVIVVDDGSDDDGATERIARSYGDSIRYVRKEHSGVAATLNAGIDAMRGRYFSWLSHDDRYHPRKIERQMIRLKAHGGTAVVFGDYDVIDEAGTFLARVEVGKSFDPARSVWAPLEGRLNGCALLVPRELFDACGRFNTGLPTTQDYALWFQMARRAPFLHHPESLVQHRTHAKQGSRVARHLEEASLLWPWMVESLSPAEIEAAGGSDLGFLVRINRWVRKSGYPGAKAFLESCLHARLAKEKAALVWADDGVGAGPEPAIAAIERAGPAVAEAFVLDLSPSADVSLQLRSQPSLRRANFVRTNPGAAVETLFELADLVTAPLVVLASRHGSPTAAAVQHAIEAITADEIDGLMPHDPDPAGGKALLPPALCGAVLTRDAFARAAAALRAGAKWPVNLTTTARLGAAPPLPRAAAPAAAANAPPGATGLSSPATGRGALLIVVHAKGGGAHVYAEMTARIARSEVDVIFAWGTDNERLTLSCAGPGSAETAFDLPGGLDQAIALLHARQVLRLDVMQLQGLEQHIDTLVERLGVPFDLTLLDYQTVAHSPHLTAADGAFVGDDALRDPAFSMMRAVPALLRNAERRIASSRDTAARFARLVPGLPFTAARIVEPGEPHRFMLHPAPLREGEDLRVLLPGRFGATKGARVALDVARLANEAGAPLSFFVLGDIPAPPEPALQRRMALLGRFDSARLNELVCRIRPHLAWLPFTAPETHSFTLSQAMLQGLPILTVGIGAIAERVEGRPSTWVLERQEATPEGYFDWLNRLWRERLSTPARWLSTAHLPPLHDRFYETEYLAPLRAARRTATGAPETAA